MTLQRQRPAARFAGVADGSLFNLEVDERVSAAEAEADAPRAESGLLALMAVEVRPLGRQHRPPLAYANDSLWYFNCF